jgi:hypothetical protein
VKYFITEGGKIVETGTVHAVYTKRVMKMKLSEAMKKLVRVQIFNRFLGFETDQHKLTDPQRTTLNRLYKRHSCIAYAGRVRSNVQVSPREDCVTRINYKLFGV